MLPTPPSWPEIVLLCLMIAYPLYGAITFRRTREELLSGVLSRRRVYSGIIVSQWLAVAILAAIWWHTSRPAFDLGISTDLFGTASTPRLLGAWGASLLLSAYLLFQVWAIGRSAAERDKVRQQVGDLDVMLPRTRGQAWGFSAVGLTAGICEELLYRGFLLWWCQAALGWNLATAAVASTLLFGLGHAYQGWQGIVRTGLVGAVLMIIRLAAGSLWPAMVLHAAADIFGGWMVYRARPELDDTSSSSPSMDRGDEGVVQV